MSADIFKQTLIPGEWAQYPNTLGIRPWSLQLSGNAWRADTVSAFWHLHKNKREDVTLWLKLRTASRRLMASSWTCCTTIWRTVSGSALHSRLIPCTMRSRNHMGRLVPFHRRQKQNKHDTLICGKQSALVSAWQLSSSLAGEHSKMLGPVP